MCCRSPGALTLTGRRRILLATRNAGKAEEIRAVLQSPGVEAIALDEFDPDRTIPEPEETGETFADNARDKAAYYARAAGCWALADDSGLLVDALGGAPGVRSARYARGDAPADASKRQLDAANNARLLRELAGTPADKRSARFICRLALSDGERTVLEAGGAVCGVIAEEPAGDNGFGYDPLFFIPDRGRTAAQLPPAEKNRISHRGRAVREFAGRLKELLKRSAEV